MNYEQNNSLANSIIAKENANVKWGEKKRKNLLIAKKMLRLSQMCEDKAETLLHSGKDAAADYERRCAEIYKKRGYRMKECSRFINFSICPDCNRSIASSATLCRDRVCPTCAWRLSAKQSTEMMQTLSFINDIEEYDALFLTLTVRNCDCDQLDATLAQMSSAWNKMLSRRKNRALIRGTARSVEITYNHKAKTFHPHYHIILLIDKDKRDINELSVYFNKEWQSAAKLTYQPITDLRKIENKTLFEYDAPAAELYKNAIIETFKYTIKDDSLAEMPLSTFRHYIDGVQSKRLVAYTGIIKEARAKLDFVEELEDEQAVIKCPDCSSEMMSAIFQWSFAENTYKRFIDNVSTN